MATGPPPTWVRAAQSVDLSPAQECMDGGKDLTTTALPYLLSIPSLSMSSSYPLQGISLHILQNYTILILIPGQGIVAGVICSVQVLMRKQIFRLLMKCMGRNK